MLIYFAAPLFNEAERRYNEQLTARLEERGFSVFLPQRDGIESGKPPFSEMAPAERAAAIFALDRDHLLKADILLFILDGRVPDEGACVELGLAYGQKMLLKREKLLIGLHTDHRVAFPDARLNAMIQGALDTVVEEEDALLARLEAYRQRVTAG